MLTYDNDFLKYRIKTNRVLIKINGAEDKQIEIEKVFFVCLFFLTFMEIKTISTLALDVIIKSAN